MTASGKPQSDLITFDTLVEFHQVSKKFHSKVILHNLSFSLSKGLITTLVGQNGAGKTTIAKMILGLSTPTSGTIDIKSNITIGYVPQKLDYYAALPMDASSLLRMLAGAYDPSALDHLDTIFKFKHLLTHDIADLSGGQLQKMMLVSSILSMPDLLILDEPTQYLDVSSQQQFYRVLDWVKNAQGVSVFLISHDLFAVMKNSDQVICINEHICCSGRPSAIRSDPALAKVLDEEIGLYIHTHDHEH